MKNPNIIFILADDMGYGDVSCMNPEGKIPTKSIDKIASQGMAFTNAHATSAICSPSRYSVLTGRYCWRRMPAGIVGVYGEPLLKPGRMTVAGLLKKAGYSTTCFGKWHLGMGWAKTGKKDGRLQKIDFTKPVDSGPLAYGFDEYFGVDVPNWPPFCFIEGDRTVGIPAGEAPFGISNEEISVKGPCVEGWKLEGILPGIIDKACGYIRKNAGSGKPFFVYLPLTSPHTPLAVNERWKGKSGLNLYADFVMETDAMVGRIIDALDETGSADETLLIFASDNGCAHYIGADYLESMGHFPSHIFRGYKSDAWDGGHRIPLVARWPGKIEPKSVCENPVSLSDFFATAADITGSAYPESAAEDSVSFLPILLGGAGRVRNEIISHSIYGKFSICIDGWKLILCPGSGGFGNHDVTDEEAAIRGYPKYQLYDLDSDPGEKINLYLQNADKASELKSVLDDIISRGRSTPGAPQPNDLRKIDADADIPPRNYSYDDWKGDTG